MKMLVPTLFSYFLFGSLCVGFSFARDDPWILGYIQKNNVKDTAPHGSGGPGTPVKISSSMFILDIDKVDDYNMDFNIHFYFRQSWKDPRLKFADRKDHVVLRNVDDIWTPDLFFVEEREGSLHEIIHPNIFCRIMPDGKVLFSVRLTEKISCPMDLRSYPHDIQKCQMNIESYGFRKEDIELEWSKSENPPVSAAENIVMLEFDLIDLSESSSSVSMNYGNYSRLEVHLKFKRRFGFHAVRLYIPFIVLVLMSVGTFCIKAEDRCLRLSLLLVILYLASTLSSEENDAVPPAPYLKASDVWIGCCMSLIFATFVEFIFVSVIASRENNEDGSATKGDILLSLDPESKDKDLESDSLKSRLSKLTHMFSTRNGGNGRRNTSAQRIDKICRIVFPIIFIIFNIVYWSVYCCP